MFSKLSETINENKISYPILDNSLPFSEYISRCQSIIEERRTDLQETSSYTNLILNVNSPFELQPSLPIYSGNQFKYGILLIHGLLDCPFSLRDIGKRFQHAGMLVRSVLLPGHGTTPSDLLTISYHDWIQTVRYGIETLKQEVEQIFLVGYSTGAALSLYHALQDSQIAGIVLLAPAIRIKIPFDIIVTWHYILKTFSSNKEWLHCQAENDYAKYQSIAFNPVKQVSKLTTVVDELQQHRNLSCPVFMAVSHEDETISSHTAIDFFSSLGNQDNQLLLYTSYDHAYPDPRIFTRDAIYPNLNIRHFSHVSIPFAPDNSHYGQHGDYSNASHPSQAFIFGAYNHLEVKCYDFFHKFHLIKKKRRELSYNPDFDFMAEKIIKFVMNTK